MQRRYLSLLRKTCSIVNTENVKLDNNTKARLKETEPEYDNLVRRIYASIKEVIRIGQKGKLHYLLDLCREGLLIWSLI
jgi:hypothetical protein